MTSESTLTFGYDFTSKTSISTLLYPKELIHSSKLFNNPEMMTEKTLKKFTGLTALQFWQLTDQFIESGLRPGRGKISFPAMVLLHLIKGLFINDISTQARCIIHGV